MRTRFSTILFLTGVFVAVANSAQADLVISKAKTSGVTCSGGICNATTANAVLNVKDLTNMLATSDVSVFAEGVATEITVSDPFGWASTHALTLGTYGSLNVKAAISIMGTSELRITTNAAETGGAFRLVGIGKVSFWDTGSTLIINGTVYTLFNDLPDLIIAIAENSSGTYALAKDYNAAQDGSYAHSPIPTTFNGVFEGLGNAIDNLKIYNPNSGNENIALFSQVGATGQLSDVNLTNVSVQSNTGPLAPLASLNYGTVTHASASGVVSTVTFSNLSASAGLVDDNEGTITRSHAGVNVSGGASSGGLAAANNGTISISDASGSVSGFEVGGLVQANNGTITTSNASGPVSAQYSGGGLVQANSGTITTSYASGSVTGDESGGGLVDSNSGTITASYASGRISASRDAGGLVTYSTGPIYASYALGDVVVSSIDDVSVGGLVGSLVSGTIQDCFATGSVADGQSAPTKRHHFSRQNVPPRPSGSSLGGLVGVSNGNIEDSYAKGSVSADGVHRGRLSSIGGLLGLADHSSTIYQSYSLGKVNLNAKKFLGGVIGTDNGSSGNKTVYWDLDTSGISNRDQGAGNIFDDKGLRGVTDKQLDSDRLLRHLNRSVWAQSASINNGYPYLIANPPPQ